MIKIDAIVREDKMQDVQDALKELRIQGMTISQVMGCGASLGYTQRVRASTVDVSLVPKVKFEIVVSSMKWAEKAIDAISTVAKTGEHGDGKIFIYEIKDAVRIRTGERGKHALYDVQQLLEEEDDDE